MVWLKPTLLKLIKLFEEQPHLWKTGHPQYENEELKEAAYSEIASNLGVKPVEVPIKWDQLKRQYILEKIKIFNSNGVYKSDWFGMESLDFINEDSSVFILESLANEESVVCRSCMADDQEIYNVFTTQIEEGWSTVNVFNLLTGIKILKTDIYSKSICKGCLYWLEEFLKFRKRAHSVQKLLTDSQSVKLDQNSIIEEEIYLETPINSIEENIYETILEKEIIILNPQPTQEDIKLSPKHANKKQYNCKICSKTFDKRDQLNIHLFIHKQKYICKKCGMELASRESFKSHQLIHTGEKPYVCKICNKGFRQSTTLKFHMKVHTGKDIECPHCGHMFARATDLRIHIQSLHSGNQPTCGECGKNFKIQSSLQNHIDVVHRGIRHVCDTCGKLVTTKKQLQKHRATHLREGSAVIASNDCQVQILTFDSTSQEAE